MRYATKTEGPQPVIRVGELTALLKISSPVFSGNAKSAGRLTEILGSEVQYERDLASWNALTSTERKRLRREGHTAPEMPKFPFYKSIPKMIWVVRARAFFSDKAFPHEELASILRAFEGLAAEIAGAALKNAAWEGRKDQSPLRKHSRHLFATTFREV
jgi:hypothetical protein